eukprot:8920207-Pyramimonas_sp.AAC.1
MVTISKPPFCKVSVHRRRSYVRQAFSLQVLEPRLLSCSARGSEGVSEAGKIMKECILTCSASRMSPEGKNRIGAPSGMRPPQHGFMRGRRHSTRSSETNQSSVTTCRGGLKFDLTGRPEH